MKLRLLLLTLLSLLLVTSCELFTDEPQQGDVYYINVGIDYKNNTNTKDDLDGTIRDAEELNQALGAVISKAKRSSISFLMTQKGASVSPLDPTYPTWDNIKNYLVSLQTQTNEEDLTIFSYSGHGHEETGLLVLAYTGVGHETLDPATLLSWIDPIPGKKLVILDSCFSGMFVESSPSSTSTVLDNSIQEFFETYHSSSTYEKPDLYVLTASAHADSYEMDFGIAGQPHQHGVFTYALLEALGWNHPHVTDISTIDPYYPPVAKKGRITVDGLYRYIIKNQAIPSSLKLFGPWTEHQHPLTTGGPLDLVLFNL